MARDTHSFRDIDWQKAQEQYLDSLKSFSREMGLPDHANSINTLWLQAFASRQPSNIGFDAKNQRDVFANLLEQSRVFYSITEQFSGLLKRIAAIPEDSDEWQDVLGDYFENMKQPFIQPPHAGQDDTANLWQENLQQWLNAFCASSIFLGDFQQQQEKFAFPDIHTFFSTPGSGQAREYQERLQQSARLWQTCLENYREYEKVLSAIGRDSIDRLHEKIIHTAKLDKKIHSLRELYDLWINAQEEVYARAVFTEEYTELYGRLINSLMEFRQHNQGMFAEILSAFNLPTHEEMGNISKAQQKLRRDIQFIRQQQQTHESEVNALKKELEEIRQSLAEIRGRPRQKKT